MTSTLLNLKKLLFLHISCLNFRQDLKSRITPLFLEHFFLGFWHSILCLLFLWMFSFSHVGGGGGIPLSLLYLKLIGWSSADLTPNLLFFLFPLPSIPLTSITIYKKMIPQIYISGPCLSFELQTHMSNFLFDISTWMLNRYIQINIPNLIHNFLLYSFAISKIPILRKWSLHQLRNFRTMHLLSHFPLSKLPDSVDSK